METQASAGPVKQKSRKREYSPAARSSMARLVVLTALSGALLLPPPSVSHVIKLPIRTATTTQIPPPLPFGGCGGYFDFLRILKKYRLRHPPSRALPVIGPVLACVPILHSLDQSSEASQSSPYETPDCIPHLPAVRDNRIVHRRQENSHKRLGR